MTKSIINKLGKSKAQTSNPQLQSTKQTKQWTNFFDVQTTNLTTSPTDAMTTKTTTPTGIIGSFRDYRLSRYWDNFNFELYDRICEIKMTEI